MTAETKPEKMNVPLLDLRRQWPQIREEALRRVVQVLDEQSCVLGPMVAELEQEIARHSGVPHAIGCASGTDAILLGLRALGVQKGEEVVTSPFTFFATAGATVNAGGRPVFVDIEPDSFNIDARRIEEALTPRTRVIMPVHLYGQCADMDAITAIAAKRGISVLEDAAQSLGAEDKGRRAGSMGDIGAYSFYPSKNLGGVGDGGMMVCRDAAIAERLRTLRTHGGKQRYFHDEVGWNSRLDSLQAAVLVVKLRHLDAWSEARRRNAAYYDEALAGIDGLRTPKALPGKRHIYNQYMVRSDRRDDLMKFLGERGVGTAIYYPLSLHEQECFRNLGYVRGQFPESERACRENLSLPVHPELTEAERDHVVRSVRAFHGAR
ncbi:MAG: dTDP-3-amino-3,4,6-trideoxy-alpha-D-glucose transaminase [Planctomycetes bacterium]|nr:dTDP-3-amino-3,4,6-trideoxy-alpha-D-glucose transaminase [Planctomycetota bacterium]